MSKKKKEQAGSSRRHFSVSKEFSEVDKILDALPDRTMSRFVCEAIMHYSEVKNNPEWLLERIEGIMGKRTELLHLEQSLKESRVPVGVPAESPTPDVAPTSMPVAPKTVTEVVQEAPIVVIEETKESQVSPEEKPSPSPEKKAEPVEEAPVKPRRRPSYMNRA